MAEQGTIFVEGFLIKRGHMRHSWKIRWFKLSKSSLRYYTDKKHNVPHGRICLNEATLTKNEDTEFSDRENVFVVTIASGVRYPIQAPTSAEYKVWINAIQKVVDCLNPEKSGTCSLKKSHPGVINSSLASDEHKKAEIFDEIRKSRNGVLAHSKAIEGVLYDQVVSGVELRRWFEKTIGMDREEAEDAIQSLVQIGFIDCLTSKSLDFSLCDNTHYFRLLADETSIQSMSSSYLKNFKTTTIESSTTPRKQKKSSPYGSGLPSDLPPGDIRKRGILFKRGHIVPSWKARCFVLQECPATLSYFDPSKKKLKTINTLSLRGATAFPLTKTMAETKLKINNPPDHLFCLQTSTGALYPITAATEKEKLEWMKEISSLSH